MNRIFDATHTAPNRSDKFLSGFPGTNVIMDATCLSQINVNYLVLPILSEALETHYLGC